MDWFLCDNGLRHERVNKRKKAVNPTIHQNPAVSKALLGKF